jgi:hypothetical protein
MGLRISVSAQPWTTSRGARCVSAMATTCFGGGEDRCAIYMPCPELWPGKPWVFRPRADIKEAARLFRINQIWCILVVNQVFSWWGS